VVVPSPPTGIAILDRETTEAGTPNYNHIVYAKVAPLYAHDALAVLRSDPLRYLHAVAAAGSLFFRPASDYEYFKGFRRRVPAWDGLYRVGLYGQLTATGPGVPGSEGFPLAISVPNVGWFIVVAMPLLLWLGVRRLRAAHGAGDIAAAGTLAFIVTTIVYLLVVATALNIGENQRYRFMTEPFLFVLAGAARLPKSRTGAGRAP